jgi:hypothetical protein
MRKLTISRKKSFVGCAGKLKVYITDPLHTELDICGEGCRKIGEIKNGQTESFEIDEREGRVFVIADKASRNWCNDSRPIPAGDEDIEFSGKCRYNPAVGNAFRFDGEADDIAIKNKKAGGRKGCLTTLIAIICGVIISIIFSSMLF